MDKRLKDTFSLFLLLSTVTELLILYYYAYPMWASIGLRNTYTDQFMLALYRSGNFSSPALVGGICLMFCLLSNIVRASRAEDASWREILLPLGTGCALHFLAHALQGSPAMVPTSVAGYALFFVGTLRLGRKVRSFDAALPDYWDTFEQCGECIGNRYSVNIPMSYQYGGRMHRGYINVVNPFRGTLVIGTPGSGKSYSVYGPFIRQMIRKGYSLFVYDYKFPDLTGRVLNELLDSYGCYGDAKPKMYVVSFDDPLYSHRFNPIHPSYLQDPVDSTEIAEVILKNANRESASSGNDFFALSARCYLDLLIWFLKTYEGGRYCTFPHLIELMGQDYRRVLDVLGKIDELEVKRTTFADAMKDQAYEQLQGQIASARVPLMRFASKTLYWTLSGDDFSLDINNPQSPKIVCVGNNPKRQSVYGTTLAMLTSQLFKIINNPGRTHCAVLIDELPTIYLKGLDTLINTARSNKVAVVIGAQDKSQLIKDYDKKESDVIFNTVGNVFAGAVKGETAQGLSRSFGKVERETRSYLEGDSSDSVTHSYQLRDVLPPDKIESLSQGSFCGYVADNFDQKVNPKTFCGEIDPGDGPRHKAALPQIIKMGGKDEAQDRELIMREVDRNFEKVHNEILRIIYS